MERPSIVVVSSKACRTDPSGPLLRLMRQYVSTFKLFTIHATGGTARSILSTGLYTSDADHLVDPDVIIHPFGYQGGVVDVASMVPRSECVAVFFFLDPEDALAEVPENRAFQRVCKELGMRLISTIASAHDWLEREAPRALSGDIPQPKPFEWPVGWTEFTSHTNVDSHGRVDDLPRNQQTLALIAHDRRKEDMVLFVNAHAEFLSEYHCVLATGTTGFILKLLYSRADQSDGVLAEAHSRLETKRFKHFLVATIKLLLRYTNKNSGDLPTRRYQSWLKQAESLYPNAGLSVEITADVGRWKKDMPRSPDEPEPVLRNVGHPHLQYRGLEPHEELVRRILPMPSGPKGGDILLANEVLKHRCHAAVFFQDPGSPHAHDADIRLFERTCHFVGTGSPSSRVHIACVSDPLSAHHWASAHGYEVSELSEARLADKVRQRFDLRDVVLCDPHNSDGIVEAMARCTARYLALDLAGDRGLSSTHLVGIGYGEMISHVLDALEAMLKADTGLLDRIQAKSITCAPLGADLGAYPLSYQASTLADRLARLLGMEGARHFTSTCMVDPADYELVRKEDQQLMDDLSNARTALVSAGDWPKVSSLYGRQFGGAKHLNAAVGVFALVLLDKRGQQVVGPLRQIGVGCEGMKRAARRGNVILLGYGSDRHPAIRSALAARLASVWITSEATCRAAQGWEMAPAQD